MTRYNVTSFPYPAYVYVIGKKGNSSQIKIGHSTSPAKRIANLQSASPSKLQFVHVVACPNKAIARELESALHFWLRKYRRSGEWFACRSRAPVTAFFAHNLKPLTTTRSEYAEWTYKQIGDDFMGLREAYEYKHKRPLRIWSKRLAEWVHDDRVIQINKRAANRAAKLGIA